MRQESWLDWNFLQNGVKGTSWHFRTITTIAHLFSMYVSHFEYRSTARVAWAFCSPRINLNTYIPSQILLKISISWHFMHILLWPSRGHDAMGPKLDQLSLYPSPSNMVRISSTTIENPVNSELKPAKASSTTTNKAKFLILLAID